MEKVVNKPWLQWFKENSVTTELTECSIYKLLERTTNKYPERTAIIFNDEFCNYSTLKTSVDKLAGTWQEIGLKKGDRIGLMMSNHPLYIVSYYAAHALGLIVVQVNPLYTFRELIRISENSQMQYIVYDKTASPTVQAVKKLYEFTQCFSIEKEEGFMSLDSLIENGVEIRTIEEIYPNEDIAVIQYTGGTGGDMKGVMLTHSNLTSNVSQGYEMYGIENAKEAVVLTATPLYHVYAMTSAMNLSIFMGASILLIAKFDVQIVLDSIRKYKPSFFPGVPKMYSAFINFQNIQRYDLSCLKYCTCGSAPLPIEVIKRFKELSGVMIAEGFGLSEASPTTHRNPVWGKQKVGSIGVPIRDTDCKIIDEDDYELGPNVVGELLIKGPQIMKGYWNNEIETKKALQNEWLHTGDLAMMDEEGYFFIVGRKKELIIINGFNIYPQEVEEVLYEYPDIQEVAVIGIVRDNSEEVIKAFIVPKTGVTLDLEVIKQFCCQKLAPYKVPKLFVIIKELPRNTVGKILKRLLN
ncbi:long-chain-fatty-acid--CoA ligase [Sporosarcina obsidiansis]|uniref:long-chain-fatty-acid--CoA ligase n=1 Tax=Sporosarcina obsidiansis TaxID=2660748 RepID=UPI00129ACB0B|nr:long-chain fatty acid--CoA ligase [Sporosarcina obsidiansis]